MSLHQPSPRHGVQETTRVRHAATVLAFLELAGEAYDVHDLQRRLPGTPPDRIVVALADLQADELVGRDERLRWRAIPCGGGVTSRAEESRRVMRADALHQLLLSPRGRPALTVEDVPTLADLGGWNREDVDAAVADLVADGRLADDELGRVDVAPLRGTR